MRNSSHHSYERSNTIDEMDNLIGIAYIDRNCPVNGNCSSLSPHRTAETRMLVPMLGQNKSQHRILLS